jgi:hypothetical protein
VRNSVVDIDHHQDHVVDHQQHQVEEVVTVVGAAVDLLPGTGSADYLTPLAMQAIRPLATSSSSGSAGAARPGTSFQFGRAKRGANVSTSTLLTWSFSWPFGRSWRWKRPTPF